MESTRRSRLLWKVGLVAGGVLFIVGSISVMAGKDDRPNSPPPANPFREILKKLDEIQDKLNSIGGAEQNHTLRWDRVLPAAQRFVVLAEFNNEAVLDKETGLVWERRVNGSTFTWFLARYECTGRATGGRFGWRLPSIHELQSLIDPSVASPGPTLPTGHPFINVQTVYWSATTNASSPDSAWGVFFDQGIRGFAPKDNGQYFWCVRGPMQESVY
mgnify:CR=1 FL=1